MRCAKGCSWLVRVVLFFVLIGSVWADDGSLRKAMDQLSSSYVEVQQQLRDREVALQALTTSLAIARTESELFQQLWSETQIRSQMLGANLTESDIVVTHRQLVESLRKFYLVEADRQRLAELLKRLVIGIESKRDITCEVAAAKELVIDKTISTAESVSASTLAAVRVLEVNAKLKLVVLNIGTQNGARVGMPFTILRDDRVVAELRIVEVRRKVCGALIEKIENNVTLQAGDTAQVTKS